MNKICNNGGDFTRLFAISDLHLSFGCDKPMDIFKGWDNYTERIEKNWNSIVTNEDAVVIPGDISWGLKLEETKKDFEFLNKLNGKKIIIKGNHDLWWSTAKKLSEFFERNNFNTIEIVFNNCVSFGKFAIAGTRGWIMDDTVEQDKKIILRESARLETSISAAKDTGLKVVTFLHYPPAYGDFYCREIFDVIHKYDIKRIYYGHIHGIGVYKTLTYFEDVKLNLVSCDCVGFTPVLIC